MPRVTALFTSQTEADVYLVGSLDGSSCKGRYPYCYFEVTGPDGPSVVREYETIILRAVHPDEGRELFRRVLERAEHVTPAENPPVTEDREDDKFLAAALAGGADAIITNDQHLLDVHPYQGIEIVRPAIFQRRLSDNAAIYDEPAP